MSDAGHSSATDTLLGGRVRLYQPERGYRVAIDPVLLAAAIDVDRGARILDVGCGVGGAALCLHTRAPDSRIDGLERVATFADLARRNADLNDATDGLCVHLGDLTDPPDDLLLGSYDQIMTNPPHHPAHHGHPPPDPLARAAERESTADLKTWISFCGTAVVEGGMITVIHRYDRATELCRALKGAGCGDLIQYPLWPSRQGEGAKRVIVRATKGAPDGLRETAGLVLHDSTGEYGAAAQAILRDGQPLNFNA